VVAEAVGAVARLHRPSTRRRLRDDRARACRRPRRSRETPTTLIPAYGRPSSRPCA
jgi:hypothetical protein